MNTPRGVNRAGGRGALIAVTLIFIVLGLSLSGLITLYRKAALEPRLRAEAKAQAEILSRSQGGLLASVLRSGQGAARRASVEAAMDELLLLRDEASGSPYFDWISLEIDHDVLGEAPGSLDVRKGVASATDVFPTTVALYDPRSMELLGVAKFGVSSRLFRELSARVAEELWRVTLVFLVILAVLWAVLVAALAKLEKQTERRFAAERDLSQQEQQYERLVNNLAQYFVYRKDASGWLLTVSHSVERVLGFAPQEFATQHSQSLQAGAPVAHGPDFEVELEDVHGQKHRIAMSEVPVLNEKGEVIAYDGIARDATAERRYRDELQHAKEEAEAANLAKSHFLANMSHEIRTPLTAILGMAGLALRSVRDPRDRDYLEKIRTSARLLVDIVEDILDLSRIEAGRLELAVETFDLQEMLAEISDVIGVKAGARGLEVMFQPKGRLPQRLVGDVVRLKQVLLNLLNNAVKFTEKGEIVATIETVESRRDRVALRFTISDTGIGIEESHLHALFEPFSQVDGSTTRRYGGMGLGLVISRRLVRLMDGDIQVTSQPGLGSSFTFVATFGLAEGGEESQALPETFTGLRALVVDDNESARLAIGAMLEMLTCRVDTVASGEEALAAYSRATAANPYRVALVDWKMPGLDGVETSMQLRTLAGDSPLGLILVTAHDWEEAARKAESAGIAAVLHKPLSPSSLHDAMVTTLSPGHGLRGKAQGPAPTMFAPGQTVLLVEDQAINRELARELLTQAGLAVDEATNGREALQYLEGHRPAAVLMDVQMPDMDGLTAVRAVRENPRLKGLPVVAMTAHAMLGDRERFLAAGMSDYVAKPVDEALLFRVLGRWLKAESSPEREATSSPTPEARIDAEPLERVERPVLDRDAGLRRAGGNRRLYERLVRGFANEAPDLVKRIGVNAEKGDDHAVRRDLHTLKGNASTVSAMEIAALAGRLEKEKGALPSPQALDGLTAALARLAAEVPPEAPAEPKVEPPTTGPRLTDAQRSEGEACLARFADHVASGNLAARRSFAELKLVIGASFPASMGAIESSLDGLDFDGAAREIEELRPLLSAKENA